MTFSEDVWAAINRCFGLHTKFLARITPEGRAASKALFTWKAMIEEQAVRKARGKRALGMMSPEGRMMGKGFRAWNEFATTRRRRTQAIKEALARMTPEGRAKYAGLQGFKCRTPVWTPNPMRTVTPDGFWVTSKRPAGERPPRRK